MKVPLYPSLESYSLQLFFFSRKMLSMAVIPAQRLALRDLTNMEQTENDKLIYKPATRCINTTNLPFNFCLNTGCS